MFQPPQFGVPRPAYPARFTDAEVEPSPAEKLYMRNNITAWLIWRKLKRYEVRNGGGFTLVFWTNDPDQITKLYPQLYDVELTVVDKENPALMWQPTDYVIDLLDETEGVDKAE